MTNKELNAFEEKKKKILAASKAEIERCKEDLEKKNAEIQEAILNEDIRKRDALFDDIDRLESRIRVTQSTVEKCQRPENPYFTDEDVQEGWNQYAATYNKKAAAVIRKYKQAIEMMYDAFIENAGMRAEGQKMRDDYNRFLLNPETPMAKLDTFGMSPQNALMLFREYLDRDGVDMEKLQSMCFVNSDNRL